jgi:hypothetical protein
VTKGELMTKDKEPQKGKEIKFPIPIKVVSMSNDRTVIVFPKELREDTKRLRGKFVWLTIEEVVR